MTAYGILGTPYRVAYTAKNFVSGLTQISLKVIRPDGFIFGPFDLEEFPDLDLSGVYYYDYTTLKSDPIGDYLVVINNPEQNIKEAYRLQYGVTGTSQGIEQLLAGFKKNYFGE